MSVNLSVILNLTFYLHFILTTMNLKYYLANPESSQTTILLSITHNSKRIKIMTNLRIKSIAWNSKMQKVKPNYENCNEINKCLLDLETYITSKYFNNFEYDLKAIKVDVLEFLNKPKNNLENKNLVYHIERYIEENLNNGRIRKTSAKQKKVLISFLNEMNPDLELHNVNKVLMNNFTKFLISKNYSNDYIKKQIVTLRTFISNYLLPNKLIDNLDYKEFSLKDFKVNETTFIALTEKELLELKGIDNLNEKLSKVRDLFLFQCYTGLRVSDLLNIQPENIDLKNDIISFNNIKTSKSVKIPLIDVSKNILIKYNYNLPKISDVKYNLYLKELFKLLNFNEMILNVKFIGNERIEYKKPKYEMISSHTARRTFITMLLNKGMLPEKVMKLSGHTNRNVFDNYVKVTQNESINEMKNLFFT